MKVKAISRSSKVFQAESAIAMAPTWRNHKLRKPFLHEREYVRALNATKLERHFAKPFIGAMEGHIDGIWAIHRHPTHVSTVFSASADGELFCWSVPRQQMQWKVSAHTGWINALAVTKDHTRLLTVSSDCSLRVWPTFASADSAVTPLLTIQADHPLDGGDASPTDDQFVTGSRNGLEVWNPRATEPIQCMQAGTGEPDIGRVSISRSEPWLVLATGGRALNLFDLREGTAIRRVILATRPNCIAWNPMEPLNCLAGCDDGNLYTFDIRKLSRARTVHEAHEYAVMACAFSPTGREFASGSFDRTVRLWDSDAGRPRDTYHTRRMQRVLSVEYSGDGRFVFSGSEDANLRIWKSVANESLKVEGRREKASKKYHAKLQKKFEHVPELREIRRQRVLPKYLHNAAKKRHIQREKAQRKKERRAANRSRHLEPEVLPTKREQHIISEKI